MEKECENCYSMGGCYFIPHIHPSLCPCKDCIIKMICRDSCDKWLVVEEYVRSLEHITLMGIKKYDKT